MKLIMESWRSYLKEVSYEEAEYFGQQFKELSEDPSKLFDAEWLNNNIGPVLGAGAFRVTHAIKGSKDMVFKRANKHFTIDASYMNSEEKRLFNQFPEYFPKVYLTSPTYTGEELERFRKKLHFGMGTRKIEEHDAYVPWIIVEKVKPFQDYDYTEWNNFLMNKYQSLKDIYIVLWNSILKSGGSINYLLKKYQKGQDLRKTLLYYLEGDLEIKAISYNLVHTYLRNTSVPFQESVRSKIIEILENASDLQKLKSFVEQSSIGVYDIRPDNTGTDADTETKLLFIDINKF